jgi:dTDP-4-amino-4,6-dideoxygalactose transaminase
MTKGRLRRLIRGLCRAKLYLNGLGVQTVISYPTALPFLPAYARFGHQPGDFPNAYQNQSRILSIPIFSEMTQAQQEAVAAAIRSFPA